jgi:hypothetical protein
VCVRVCVCVGVCVCVRACVCVCVRARARVCVHKSRYGAGGIAASLPVGQPRDRVSISGRGKEVLLLFKASRQVVGLTQPPL